MAYQRIGTIGYQFMVLLDEQLEANWRPRWRKHMERRYAPKHIIIVSATKVGVTVSSKTFGNVCGDVSGFGSSGSSLAAGKTSQMIK